MAFEYFRDCPQGSDEDKEMCAFRNKTNIIFDEVKLTKVLKDCPKGWKKCNNGSCVIEQEKCDSIEECGDDCDTEGICDSGEFHCGNRHCISMKNVCDGVNDCGSWQVMQRAKANICFHYSISG